MRNAVFWGANLSNSKFSYANLDGTDFRHSKISWTVFAGVNLAVCFGLEDVLHGGPSSIGMDTLYLSRGFIAETFLGRCALDAAAISFAKSLTRGVLHWRFMSYSSKDQDFAVRLHANLQARGVVCWLATEELKLGDISRQRRDEAIRASDKLLVVLSESSIISRWLQDEVESAIERESREHRLILFPIRIDSAVMDSDQTWAARIRRTRYIGDFSKWQDRSSYETAFDRLLRDLKTEDDIAMTSE